MAHAEAGIWKKSLGTHHVIGSADDNVVAVVVAFVVAVVVAVVVVVVAISDITIVIGSLDVNIIADIRCCCHRCCCCCCCRCC